MIGIFFLLNVGKFLGLWKLKYIRMVLLKVFVYFFGCFMFIFIVFVYGLYCRGFDLGIKYLGV